MTSLYYVTAILVLLLAALLTRGQNSMNSWFCDYPVEDVPTQSELLDQLMEKYSKNSSTSFYPEIGFFREKYMHISSCVNLDHLELSIYDIEERRIPKAPMPRLWPSSDIPFHIDADYSGEMADRILADMSVFSNSTCIRFVNMTDESVFIRFVHPNNTRTIKTLPVYTEDGGVAAPSNPDGFPEEVEGKTPGYSGMVRTFIRSEADIVTRGSGIMPTLMFVLGFKREELRQDRDEFITLTFRSGDTKMRKMFQKELVTDFDLMWLYDTQSVTHITLDDADDLNVGLESSDNDVLPIKPRGDSVLSEGDIKKINAMYCEDYSKRSTQSSHETLPHVVSTPVGVTLGPETLSNATNELTLVTSPSGGLGGVGDVMEETTGSRDKVSELEDGSSGEGSGALHTEAPEEVVNGEREEISEFSGGRATGTVATVPAAPAAVSSTGKPYTSTVVPTPVPTTTTITTTRGVFIDSSSSVRLRVSSALAVAALLGLVWKTASQAGGN